jgi:starch phosphorylase
MGFGRENPSNSDELFCMTVLALRLSRRANAVSALHGEVSRAMWTGLFRGKPEDEIPIGHITNGVHVRQNLTIDPTGSHWRVLYKNGGI